MINISEKTKDKLVLLLPVLWIIMILSVYFEIAFMGMYVAIIHAAINVTLGLAEGEKINKKLFLVFVIGWSLVMTISVYGMVHYYNAFGNTVPTFTILGLHPSAFFLYVGYWLSNFVYLAGFFYFFRKTWLPDEKWDNFVKYAESLEENGGELNG